MKNQNNPLKEYQQKQAEIKKLLKQIETGLVKHDRKALAKGGHNWGHVGDLNSYAEILAELRDQLHGTGEYKQEPTKHIVYNRDGKAVKVVVP
jgi:hypothetical protein